MGIITLSSSITSSIMSPLEAVSTISSMESEVAPTLETVVYRKFGEMELHEEEEEDDGDYSPSEADSADSLEWASETERTIAEDALAEGTVALDFYGAAVSVATEYVSSYKPVQMGLSMATIVPVASIQRAARAARRAGTKNIEGAVDSSPCVINTINTVLSYPGFQLVSDVEDSSKPHLEPGTEPFTPEQEFGEMTLSDYDSDEDADYEPSDSESSDDELEYNSDASESEDEPEEEISGGDAEIANVL